MIDSFYTPSALAATMVEYVCDRHVDVIADFACGDGELLHAAEKRWPNARFIAADINDSVVRRLRRRHSAWTVTRCDFLRLQFSVHRVLSPLAGKVSLVLLNPPFSNRGARRYATSLGDDEFRCSQGLSFLCGTLKYLHSKGEVIAILPAGTLTSEMDAEGWNSISRHCAWEVIDKFHDRTFLECSPKTTLVRVRWKSNPERGSRKPPRTVRYGHGVDFDLEVFVVRGKVDVTVVGECVSSGAPLVHTTELKDGEIAIGSRFSRRFDAVVSGPAVLLPRVGRPDQRKVCRLRTGSSVALSNCVICISCNTDQDAEDLFNRLIQRWAFVSTMYAGTCAYYTTLRRVKAVLGSIGVVVLNRSQQASKVWVEQTSARDSLKIAR